MQYRTTAGMVLMWLASRDRENSTIFVICSSEANMTEDDLKSLFSDVSRPSSLSLPPADFCIATVR